MMIKNKREKSSHTGKHRLVDDAGAGQKNGVAGDYSSVLWQLDDVPRYELVTGYTLVLTATPKHANRLRRGNGISQAYLILRNYKTRPVL